MERQKNGQEGVARIQALIEQLVENPEKDGTLVDGIKPLVSGDGQECTTKGFGFPTPLCTDATKE